MFAFLGWLVGFLLVGLFTVAQVLRAQGLKGSDSWGSSWLLLLIGTPVTIWLFLLMWDAGVRIGIIGFR